MERHGEKGPSTCERGSRQINTIETTRQLESTANRYLPFGKSVGDHRIVWVDISY